MKLAQIVQIAVLGAAFALSGACHAAPAPPAAAETAIEPDAAHLMPIRVAGPCACETTLITAAIAELNDTAAVMLPAQGRTFGLSLNKFL